jgi:hypothetical protein
MSWTWTKLFSSSDDGSTLTGSELGTMQSDISSQAITSPIDGSNLSGLGSIAVGAGTIPNVNLGTKYGVIEVVIGNRSDTPSTGIVGDLYIPFACTLTANTLLADQSGSIVIDIWKVAYASYPETVTNTITASALPTLSSALTSQDTTLTGWTKTISAGDCLRFNVNSATTLTQVVLALNYTRT